MAKKSIEPTAAEAKLTRLELAYGDIKRCEAECRSIDKQLEIAKQVLVFAVERFDTEMRFIRQRDEVLVPDVQAAWDAQSRTETP